MPLNIQGQFGAGSRDRAGRVRALYEAFASGDRKVVEESFTDDFIFSSPLDVDLGRAGYFERCWLGSGQGQEFDFVRSPAAGVPKGA
jgi:hypothetical protein